MRGSRNFLQGGGGGGGGAQVHLVYQLSFFKVPEGVQHFPGGGVQFLLEEGGRVQLLIPYRNPYIL